MLRSTSLALFALATLVACSSSDSGSGTGASNDAGLQDAAAGGSSGSGGSAAGGSSSSGGAATGGSSGSGGSSAGGSSSSGGAATGGAPPCLEGDGHAPDALARCQADADCKPLTVPTCCGSDLVIGIASDASCLAPTPDCTGLGCPKNIYVQTEDGATVEGGSAVAVRCDYSINPSLSQGLCRTYRVPFPDCGGTRCAEGQVCVHLPPDGGGAGPQCLPMPDSGTCPVGFQPDSCGCSEIPVTPPPFCSDIPSGCGPVPTCDCFPTEICNDGPNLCLGVSGLDLQCANLAP